VSELNRTNKIANTVWSLLINLIRRRLSDSRRRSATHLAPPLNNSYGGDNRPNRTRGEKKWSQHHWLAPAGEHNNRADHNGTNQQLPTTSHLLFITTNIGGGRKGVTVELTISNPLWNVQWRLNVPLKHAWPLRGYLFEGQAYMCSLTCFRGNGKGKRLQMPRIANSRCLCLSQIWTATARLWVPANHQCVKHSTSAYIGAIGRGNPFRLSKLAQLKESWSGVEHANCSSDILNSFMHSRGGRPLS